MTEDTQNVSNRISGTTADSVIQVGFVRGNLTIHPAPLRPAEPLLVSVDPTIVESTTYSYDNDHAHPVTSVDLLVETFTPQAVILHRLRPVVTRRIHEYSMSLARMHYRRSFHVALDMPSIDCAADLGRQEVRLEEARPDGVDDFPFSVTASDPEFFVIRPTGDGGLCEWQLELDWSCLGQRGTVTIDHGNGRPFLS